MSDCEVKECVDYIIEQLLSNIFDSNNNDVSKADENDLVSICSNHNTDGNDGNKGNDDCPERCKHCKGRYQNYSFNDSDNPNFESFMNKKMCFNCNVKSVHGDDVDGNDGDNDVRVDDDGAVDSDDNRDDIHVDDNRDAQFEKYTMLGETRYYDNFYYDKNSDLEHYHENKTALVFLSKVITKNNQVMSLPFFDKTNNVLYYAIVHASNKHSHFRVIAFNLANFNDEESIRYYSHNNKNHENQQSLFYVSIEDSFKTLNDEALTIICREDLLTSDSENFDGKFSMSKFRRLFDEMLDKYLNIVPKKILEERQQVNQQEVEKQKQEKKRKADEVKLVRKKKKQEADEKKQQEADEKKKKQQEADEKKKKQQEADEKKKKQQEADEKKRKQDWDKERAAWDKKCQEEAAALETQKQEIERMKQQQNQVPPNQLTPYGQQQPQQLYPSYGQQQPQLYPSPSYGHYGQQPPYGQQQPQLHPSPYGQQPPYGYPSPCGQQNFQTNCTTQVVINLPNAQHLPNIANLGILPSQQQHYQNNQN